MAGKIIEYIVVSGNVPTQLAESVNNWIEIGYQPIGGLAFVFSGASFLYQQSMVKYEE